MEKIKVWDRFVRIFHWSLAASVVAQLATAEDLTDVHAKIGYGIVALLILRILWGFVGTRHARFTDFIYPPADILAYLKGLIQGRPKHYLGHNPAGGAMVCALLLCLVLTTLTGLLTYGAHGKGPLALQSSQVVSLASAQDGDHGDSDKQQDEHNHGVAGARVHFWKEIHESLVGITLSLIGLHILGVIASSFVHHENLILAMITGIKKLS